MTKVTVKLCPENFTLTAEGHAEGSTQVCAAVSALTLSLLGYLKNLEMRRGAIIAEEDVRGGWFHVRASGGDLCRGAFEMTAVGLLQLENSFPQQVKVEA